MTQQTAPPAAAPSGRVPLWLVLEDALAGTAAAAELAAGGAPVSPHPTALAPDVAQIGLVPRPGVLAVVSVLATVSVLLVAAITVAVMGLTG